MIDAGFGKKPFVDQSTSIGLRHIVCPHEAAVTEPSLFFAGGISNCPNWQSRLANLLADQDLTAFNPRRPDFPINDPAASDAQIKWEHQYLRSSNAVSFWFPKETVCPITLYELGTYTMGSSPIFVGVHPEYERDTELLAWTAVHRPHLKIVRSLEQLAEQIKIWIQDSSAIEAAPLALAAAKQNSIFIAGGIKGCPDWQSEFSAVLKKFELEVHNPRRSGFEINSESEYAVDLRNNHERMMQSEAISFWFPKESLNPMVLYELGVASITNKKLMIGVDPEYRRRVDVEIQTSLVRPDIEIVYSLSDLAAQVQAWVDTKS